MRFHFEPIESEDIIPVINNKNGLVCTMYTVTDTEVMVADDRWPFQASRAIFAVVELLVHFMWISKY